MEQNFLKVIEPYNVVEIRFVAQKMELPEGEVQAYLRDTLQIVRKLSQMILDKKLHASLDQGRGLLIMLPKHTEHVGLSEKWNLQEVAVNALETIDLLRDVVDVLKSRAEAYNTKLQELYTV